MSSRLEQLIRRRMAEKGFKSIREVERRAELPVDSLRNYLAGKTKTLRSDKIEKIAATLNLNVIDLVGGESYRPSKPGANWDALRVKYGLDASSPAIGSIFSEGSFVGDVLPNGSTDYYAQVDDDAMAPTIERGNFVLIRKCEKATASNRIYLLNLPDGGFSLRRIVSRIGKKGVDVIADNKAHPSETGIPAANLRVVGQVLVVMKRL